MRDSELHFYSMEDSELHFYSMGDSELHFYSMGDSERYAILMREGCGLRASTTHLRNHFRPFAVRRARRTKSLSAV